MSNNAGNRFPTGCIRNSETSCGFVFSGDTCSFSLDGYQCDSSTCFASYWQTVYPTCYENPCKFDELTPAQRHTITPTGEIQTAVPFASLMPEYTLGDYEVGQKTTNYGTHAYASISPTPASGYHTVALALQFVCFSGCSMACSLI